MAAKFRCWRCGHELGDLPKPLPRLEQCSACEADLHVCRFCRYYKPNITGKCDHDLAEPAREVDLANFCHYFLPHTEAYVAKEAEKERQAREKLAALFGDEPVDGDNKQQEDDTLDLLKSMIKDLPEK